MQTEEELSRLYGEAWQRPEEQTAETGGTNSRLAKVYVANLGSTLGLRDFQGLQILDFGAGRGVMSEALANVGAAVTSLEPWGCEYLESRGLCVCRNVHEILRGSREFDGVVMIDVWEHLTDPWNTMDQINQLLRSKGWCFVATPNPLGLNARIFHNRWREANKSTHLMFPEPKTIERMFADAGFSQWKRLRWIVRYSNNPSRILLHLCLQLLGLDGELRYLAWKI
jgi:2-polyprenyl-3-methyl-5-hydroxy-6-metoxy-1,4-benzoquinol methylase